MIQLTEFIHENQPFPRKPPRLYESEYKIAKEFGFSLREINNALKTGALLREKYLLDIAPDFLNELAKEYRQTQDKIKDILLGILSDQAIDETILDYDGALDHFEIARVLGLSPHAVDCLLNRAYEKLRKNSAMKKLLYEVCTAGPMRDEYQIRTTTKITVTIG